MLLDLVPGHTSEEHPWFQASCQEEPNEYSGRYIWTNAWFARGDGMPFVSGEAPRNGAYILNFFKCQPALNYGYGQCNQPWQQPAGSPEALATRAALWDIMEFWLERGCDGFRVDMAGSLVKHDTPDCSYTQAIYQEIREKLDAQFPEAALVSEWGLPRQALNCGFDMDFYLEWHGNGYSSLMRDYDTDGNMVMQGPDTSYFKQDSGTDVTRFLADYLPQYTDTKDKGLWCFLTCNHDTTRPSFNLSAEELKVAYGLLFTMPGAPFLYYGDEIGMAYRKLPSKEGDWQRGQYCEKGHSAHKEKARKPVYIARHHHGVQRPEYRGGYGQHITQRIEFQHHCPVEHHQRHAHKGDERAVHCIPPEPVPFCKEMRQHSRPYGRRGYEYAYV